MESDLTRARRDTGRGPGTVIARLTARQAARSGVLWGCIFGIFVASSAYSYVTLYKTQAERNHLEAAFGFNNATNALFGPAAKLQTVAGFTAYKTYLTLTILGAVWGLLASTRLLRGEEDAGRWELLATGQTTRKGATAQGLAGLSVGIIGLWVVTALIVVISGRSSRVHIGAGSALFFAVALVSSAVMFVAVGSLTSQLAPTRRQAATYAAAVLGVSYAVRMVADSGIGLGWLRWLSPLGWVEQLQPLTSPRPLALLPIVGFTAVVGALAVHLGGARDIGSSVFPDRTTSTPHLELLSGPLGLTTRLVRPVAVSWAVAISTSALLLGLVAKAAGGTISGSSLHQVFSRLGASGTGADTYLGIAFLIVAVLVSCTAVGQITAARSEEAEGRLDHLLVRPVSRSRWFGQRLLVATAIVVTSGVAVGVFTWLGTAGQNAGVRFTTLMGAGLNVVPPALCLLGVGALVMGVRPRAASMAAYGVLAWSVLVEIAGGVGSLNHWVLDTSLFHQMAAAPAVAPNWRTGAALVAIGAVTALLGGVAFRGRDLMNA